MSETERPDRTRELGDLFVSVTGDEEVTERQESAGDKRAAEDSDEAVGNVDDGLDGAIDDSLDAKTK
jgi:hypothetical protein